jgi:uncharacterized protein YjbI with pentapeptide repeats
MGGTPADRLMELAVTRFGELNDADLSVVEKVGEGREARFSDPRPPVVSAALVEWLVAAPETADLVGYNGVYLANVTLDDNLELSGAHLHHRLGLVDSQLSQVRLVDARTRSLNFNGSSLEAILANRCEVVGTVSVTRSVSAQKDADISGRVAFFGATIHGDLNFNGTHIKGAERLGVSLAYARVDGSVFMKGLLDPDVAFRCESRIVLNHATIRGGINLAGATLGGENTRSAEVLEARRLSVSTLSMMQGFSATGHVVLTGSALGVLEVDGARFASQVELHAATVADVLRWSGVSFGDRGSLSLSSVSAKTLEFDGTSWPALGRLDLHGLTFESLSRRAGTASFLDVVRRQTRRKDGYSPQPYEQLAAVLRTSGQERAAQDVLITRAEDAARTRPWWARPLLWLFGATVAYGYRPLRVIWWLLGVFLVSAVVFRLAYAAGDFGATATVHPPFSSLAFSLDALLPFIDLGQEKAWTVQTAGISPASVYYWCHVCVGWLLSSFVVAGIARTAR